MQHSFYGTMINPKYQMSKKMGWNTTNLLSINFIHPYSTDDMKPCPMALSSDFDHLVSFLVLIPSRIVAVTYYSVYDNFQSRVSFDYDAKKLNWVSTFRFNRKCSLLKLLCTLARLCEGNPLQPLKLDFFGIRGPHE